MTNIANLTPKKSQVCPLPDAVGRLLDTIAVSEELVDAIVMRRATAVRLITG
jgi:hypothetical protein